MSGKKELFERNSSFFVGKIEYRSVIPVVLQKWKGLTARNFSKDLFTKNFTKLKPV